MIRDNKTFMPFYKEFLEIKKDTACKFPWLRKDASYEKTAVVTGSSRGIGFAIAKQLGMDGYNIVMVATGLQEKESGGSG